MFTAAVLTKVRTTIINILITTFMMMMMRIVFLGRWESGSLMIIIIRISVHHKGIHSQFHTRNQERTGLVARNLRVAKLYDSLSLYYRDCMCNSISRFGQSFVKVVVIRGRNTVMTASDQIARCRPVYRVYCLSDVSSGSIQGSFLKMAPLNVYTRITLSIVGRPAA